MNASNSSNPPDSARSELPTGLAETPRRQDIETLRLLSAFGIVWFHTGAAGMSIAYGGLVAFLALSVWLSRPPALLDVHWVRRRAERLLVPWAIWFAIYALANVLRGGDALPATSNLVAQWMTGPSIHLWFLPFMCLCLLGIDVLTAHVSRPVIGAAAGVVALLLVASAPAWRPITLGLGYPALQWADAAAPVAMGLFLRHADVLPRALSWTGQVAILLAAVVVAAWNEIGVAYAVGFIAVAVMAAKPRAMPWPFDITPLSNLSFGIYLAHPLVWLGWLTWYPLANPLQPIAIFCSTALLVAAARASLPGFKRFAS